MIISIATLTGCSSFNIGASGDFRTRSMTSHTYEYREHNMMKVHTWRKLRWVYGRQGKISVLSLTKSGQHVTTNSCALNVWERERNLLSQEKQWWHCWQNMALFHRKLLSKELTKSSSLSSKSSNVMKGHSPSTWVYSATWRRVRDGSARYDIAIQNTSPRAGRQVSR